MGNIINKLFQIISKKTGFDIIGVKKYSANFSYLIGEYIFSLMSSLIVGIAVARYLGPESYGIINFAISVYAICIVITTLGIDDIIYKDMVENSTNRGFIEGTALFLKIIVSLIVYVIVCIYGYFSFTGEKLQVLLIINFAVLFQPFSVFSFVFLSLAEGKYTSISRIISYSSSSIFKIILIIIGADIKYFAFAVFLDYFLLFFVVAFIYKYKGYSKIKLQINYDYLKSLIKKAPVLFLNVLFFTSFLKFNTIYISYIYGDFHAGIYNAALRLTEAFYLIPAVILTAFFPAVIKAKSLGEEEYIRRISIFLSAFTLPFILISLFVTLFSPFIIHLLYGEKYELSYIVLAVTILSVPLIFFSTVTSKYFIIENKVSQIFYRSFLSFILLILFNKVFTNLYGIFGAGLAFSLSAFISFYLVDIFFKESRRLFLIKTKSIFFPFTYIIKLLKK